MHTEMKYRFLIHYTLSFIGGYLGLYAIVSRADLFGNAQTANLLGVVRDLIGRNFSDMLLRVGALLIYMAAVILTVWIPEHFSADLRFISIGIDTVSYTHLLLSFLSSANLSYPGTCPKPFLYCFCPVIPKVPPTMFIILSHTCSRISYITDCTLKKDNNQVNPLLPRHIPAEVSDIHHISRVHSDYRIGRSVLHALRYGSCHFQLL